jgi:ubiquitin-protein ligase E3 C
MKEIWEVQSNLMLSLPLTDLVFSCSQHYNGDISELELYFVIVNNEYGEQCEEELLPGGRHMRVTNDNVITFIHLVANHRLNYQVKRQ